MSEKRAVVLVDDDEDFRRLLTHRLREHFEVREPVADAALNRGSAALFPKPVDVKRLIEALSAAAAPRSHALLVELRASRRPAGQRDATLIPQRLSPRLP